MYFTIRKNQKGQYWWRAVGGNNEIMAASEMLSSKQACEHAISVVKKEAAAAKVHDKTDE
jgi:Uncharacterized conserved protein